MTRFGYCSEGDHWPDVLIADARVGDDYNEIVKVQQSNDGTPSGYYADGIKGVDDETMMESELDEEPVCFDHPGCYIDWKTA